MIPRVPKQVLLRKQPPPDCNAGRDNHESRPQVQGLPFGREHKRQAREHEEDEQDIYKCTNAGEIPHPRSLQNIHGRGRPQLHAGKLRSHRRGEEIGAGERVGNAHENQLVAKRSRVHRSLQHLDRGQGAHGAGPSAVADERAPRVRGKRHASFAQFHLRFSVEHEFIGLHAQVRGHRTQPERRIIVVARFDDMHDFPQLLVHFISGDVDNPALGGRRGERIVGGVDPVCGKERGVFEPALVGHHEKPLLVDRRRNNACGRAFVSGAEGGAKRQNKLVYFCKCPREAVVSPGVFTFGRKQDVQRNHARRIRLQRAHELRDHGARPRPRAHAADTLRVDAHHNHRIARGGRFCKSEIEVVEYVFHKTQRIEKHHRRQQHGADAEHRRFLGIHHSLSSKSSAIRLSRSAFHFSHESASFLLNSSTGFGLPFLSMRIFCMS